MQEINLYQPVSKGVRGALSAASGQKTLVIIGVTLAGLWGFALWQTSKLEDATRVVRNQQEAQAAMSASAGPQLDGLSDDELNALILKLSANVDAKSRALAVLAGESRGAAPGFSARLRAFGTRHIDGIWLEHLAFGASVDSVSIEGSTLSPDSVPRYLRSLAADPALKGGQIDEFVIEKPTQKDKQGKSQGRLSFKAGRRGLVPYQPAAPEEEEAS